MLATLMTLPTESKFCQRASIFSKLLFCVSLYALIPRPTVFEFLFDPDCFSIHIEYSLVVVATQDTTAFHFPFVQPFTAIDVNPFTVNIPPLSGSVLDQPSQIPSSLPMLTPTGLTPIESDTSITVTSTVVLTQTHEILSSIPSSTLTAAPFNLSSLDEQMPTTVLHSTAKDMQTTSDFMAPVSTTSSAGVASSPPSDLTVISPGLPSDSSSVSKGVNATTSGGLDARFDLENIIIVTMVATALAILQICH